MGVIVGSGAGGPGGSLSISGSGGVSVVPGSGGGGSADDPGHFPLPSLRVCEGLSWWVRLLRVFVISARCSGPGLRFS